jgi:hypothetical protein
MYLCLLILLDMSFPVVPNLTTSVISLCRNMCPVDTANKLTHNDFLPFHTLKLIRYYLRFRSVIYLEGVAKPKHGMLVKFTVYVISSTT